MLTLKTQLKLTFLFIAHDLQPAGRHVPGLDCGNRRRGNPVRTPRAPLHARPAQRRTGA
jgi:hypothetical protein